MKTFNKLSLRLLLAAATLSVASATPVSSELLLLVDVSGSVDATEFALQRTGYAQAFQSAAVQNAIAAAPGGVAVAFAYWAGNNSQQLAVGWTHLQNAADANAFAALIAAAGRPNFADEQTAVQSAIAWGYPLFSNNGFEGTRLTIDVSGDGVDNDSPAALNPGVARNNAIAAGVTTINGLTIDPTAALNTYYTNNVLGGVAPQLFTAANFGSFADAVTQKIQIEVTGVPEPTTWLLMGCGLIGIGTLRRRIKS